MKGECISRSLYSCGVCERFEEEGFDMEQAAMEGLQRIEGAPNQLSELYDR